MLFWIVWTDAIKKHLKQWENVEVINVNENINERKQPGGKRQIM